MNPNNYPHQLIVSPSQQDHYQGMLNAPVVLVKYGNYQCPQCREVHRLIQTIQQDFASVFPKENGICVIFRHFIQNSIHPQAQKAAEAAEAAAAQGQFWQMHNSLFEHQQELRSGYLVEYAKDLGLDICQFLQDISKRVHVDHINKDIESGSQSAVKAAPALFINGIRYTDRWNLESLITALLNASH
ncbi:DsbA family protein [Phormidium tenue FACHB-886]|nr:DsbA family protein [Phormidium tenue FACHB-886]